MNTNFLLHLTLIDGIGPHVIQKIMHNKRSDVQTSDLYHMSAFDWMRYFGISEITTQKLVAGLSDMVILERELELIETHKVKLVTILDESYPALLKEIHLPPIVLYFYGMGFDDNKRLAIVGSRKANEYGQRIINTIVPDLISAGYAIVSGGALGIDTMAHEAALEYSGKTIAILGSGLLKPYPSANKKLFDRIVEHGGVVASSFALTTEPFPANFPARNRIVTGLSQGCLVVQAAKKSGALISAHCALEQGREVFVVPGLFDDELSAGCHEIIQQGAKLVMSSADIFAELGDKVVLREQPILQQQALFTRAHSEPLEESARVVQSERAKELAKNYSTAQKQILAACKQPSSLEDIMCATQLSFEEVQAALFMLQLDGVISQDFTGMWVA